MRRVRWTTDASDQLEAAIEHIRQDNPTAALRVAQTIFDRIEQLTTFPAIGRQGEVKGTRELLSPPYVIVYRFTEDIVEILHIWHGSQDWR